jgi:hypothetical protein
MGLKREEDRPEQAAQASALHIHWRRGRCRLRIATVAATSEFRHSPFLLRNANSFIIVAHQKLILAHLYTV